MAVDRPLVVLRVGCYHKSLTWIQHVKNTILQTNETNSTRWRIWWTPSQGTTSARPAAHIWPGWPPKLIPGSGRDGLLTTSTDDAATSRPKAKSSERSFVTNTRPLQAATTSSCRGTRPQGITCAGGCTSSRQTGAGSAVGTRGRPATISL